jgi:phosphatidylserine decarboxylase
MTKLIAWPNSDNFEVFMNEDNILYTIRKSIPPMHPEGWKFVAAFAVVTAILGSFATSLLWVGLILTAWCAYFFRDPIRMVPARDGLMVSPADGLVQKIVSVIPPEALRLGTKERTRISIFLNVFDVHVNRIPLKGVVTSLKYIPGAFFNASLDKASEENERQYITLAVENGKSIGVVQIAGLVARRILCDLKEGQSVATGERLGIIRFGSRVDIYLPEGAQPLVIVGQRAVGGETILADLGSDEQAREGHAI